MHRLLLLLGILLIAFPAFADGVKSCAWPENCGSGGSAIPGLTCAGTVCTGDEDTLRWLKGVRNVGDLGWSSSGPTYYLSYGPSGWPTGDDTNDGKTPESAWKNFYHLQELINNNQRGGGTIVFDCEDSFPFECDTSVGPCTNGAAKDGEPDFDPDYTEDGVALPVWLFKSSCEKTATIYEVDQPFKRTIGNQGGSSVFLLENIHFRGFTNDTFLTQKDTYGLGVGVRWSGGTGSGFTGLRTESQTADGDIVCLNCNCENEAASCLYQPNSTNGGMSWIGGSMIMSNPGALTNDLVLTGNSNVSLLDVYMKINGGGSTASCIHRTVANGHGKLYIARVHCTGAKGNVGNSSAIEIRDDDDDTTDVELYQSTIAEFAQGIRIPAQTDTSNPLNRLIARWNVFYPDSVSGNNEILYWDNGIFDEGTWEVSNSIIYDDGDTVRFHIAGIDSTGYDSGDIPGFLSDVAGLTATEQTVLANVLTSNMTDTTTDPFNGSCALGAGNHEVCQPDENRSAWQAVTTSYTFELLGPVKLGDGRKIQYLVLGDDLNNMGAY